MSSNRNILGMATESTAANDLESEVGEVEFTTESGNNCAPIVQIATGRNHVLALDTSGKIYSWGRNDYGQLGLGQKRPVQVTKLDSYGHKRVATEE